MTGSDQDGFGADDHDARVDAPLQIVRGDLELNLDVLRPLWEAYRAHAVDVAASIGPAVRAGASWRQAREIHVMHLRQSGSFLLLAKRGDRLVGYVLAVRRRLRPVVFRAPARGGHIESLAVLEDERGMGIGGQLLEAAVSELARAGARRISLNALYDDVGVRRFYERHGFVPETVQMLRPVRLRHRLRGVPPVRRRHRLRGLRPGWRGRGEGGDPISARLTAPIPPEGGRRGRRRTLSGQSAVGRAVC